jgi:hypothetical protein
MIGTRIRLAVAFLAVVVAAVAVGGGNAGPGQRKAEFPAPVYAPSVTAGKNIQYRFSFKNTSDSTFTKVVVRQLVPFAQVGEQPYERAATPVVASTCPSTPVVNETPAGPEWACDFGKLLLGQQIKLSVLWKAPVDVDLVEDCPGCLKSAVRVTVKEGLKDVGKDMNDGFFPPGGAPGTLASNLLLPNSPVEVSELKAANEPACTDPFGAGSLRTKPELDAGANPVSSTWCLPKTPSDQDNFGIAARIFETIGPQHPVLVCFAALGQECGGTYTPHDFTPEFATGVFRVRGETVGPDGITQVTHNGLPLDACPESGPLPPNGCVVSITPPPGWPEPPPTEAENFWTIVVKSSTNGPYDW